MRVFFIGTGPLEYSKQFAAVSSDLGIATQSYIYDRLRDYLPIHLLRKCGVIKGVKEHERIKRINCSWEVAARVAVFCPDIVVFASGEWFDADAYAEIRKHVQQIVWVGLDGLDSYNEAKDNVERILSSADRLVCLDDSEAAKIRTRFGRLATVSKMGYNDKVFFCDGSEKRDVDICFVGTRTKRRMNFLEIASRFARNKKLKIKVYGKTFGDRKHFWKRILMFRRHPNLARIYCGRNLSLIEAANLYRRSKLCINIHLDVHDILNNRTFEVIACGCSVLSDYKPQYENIFDMDEDILCFQNEIELEEKLDLFFKNTRSMESTMERNKQNSTRKFVSVVLGL